MFVIQSTNVCCLSPSTEIHKYMTGAHSGKERDIQQIAEKVVEK